jgi:hypothetical protein
MSAFSPSDTASFPSLLRIVDLIPGSDSREVDQNSEPSIAVNPVDPMQMFAGAFVFDATGQPFFVSTDGGDGARSWAFRFRDAKLQ